LCIISISVVLLTHVLTRPATYYYCW